MNLYLVQHGEAEREEVDPARPLTGKGRSDVRKVALLAAGVGVRVDRVFHSGKLRARETADILGELLRPAAGSGETDGLAPLDDPATWEKRLRGMAEETMLVGHLPHLQRLAGLLLCSAAERKSVAFAMGGIVALERDDAGNWSLRWMVIPDLIRE
jgi:phosphohistidine phosphatase